MEQTVSNRSGSSVRPAGLLTGVVRGDKHEPPLRNRVDALCDNDMTVSDEAVGRGGSRSMLTLGKICRSVPGKLRAGKRKKTSYEEACARAGGADTLREKRREWARLRKERTFLANS